jgi:hypothetical protein
VTRSSRSGRSGTGNYTYRRNREIVLAQSDVCIICGHHGARTADHRIPAKLWPKGADGKPLPGLDSIDNLGPAHGTMGGRQPDNPCGVCGELCNQKRGARIKHRPQTRNWFPNG